MNTLTPPQLAAWIEDLRARLDSGALADIGSLLIEPFYEVADLERWVRLTLTQIDRWQASDDQYKALYYIERRDAARRLRELYKRLHGQPVSAEEIEREREWRANNCVF